VWLCGAGWERQAVPLAVYGVQLLLNFLWTPLFFKVHRLDMASADIAGVYEVLCLQPSMLHTDGVTAAVTAFMSRF
jgi:tryptophan-rich sensory protein